MDIVIAQIFHDKFLKIIFLLQVNITADIHEEIDDADNYVNVQDEQVQ